MHSFQRPYILQFLLFKMHSLQLSTASQNKKYLVTKIRQFSDLCPHPKFQMLFFSESVSKDYYQCDTAFLIHMGINTRLFFCLLMGKPPNCLKSKDAFT